VIRRGISADHEWIRAVASVVYADLGDYGRIMPSWLDHPGVLAYVDVGDALRGFVLLGFYEPNGVAARSSTSAPVQTVAQAQAPAQVIDQAYVADLLALAVHPQFQRQGVGRGLLDHSIQVAELASRHGRVSELRLTVAEDNHVGLRLYQRAGFRVLDEDHGSYDGGQRAIRMARPLRPPGDARVAP
jgi:ribosomal protein S18 acetylase RimI-like enzyme